MQVTVAFVPSMIGNSVAAALIGLTWGPVYPECSSMEIEVLDADIHLISLSILSSTSTLGSAIFPFVAGTLSRYTGAGSLAYYFLAQAVALCVFWTIFPSDKPTKKESPV
jgi:fucose permease